jgi:hypothetical protein
MTDICDLKGAPVRIDGKAMTVEDCCTAALVHLFPNEDVTADVKAKRFKLAVRISQAETMPPLAADDVQVIKTVVGKYWNPLVVGRVLEVIDPEGLKSL